VVVVYKVDRLTRPLANFAKLVGLFEAHGVSFVSVTRQFNTITSMGRLTLNVLLSFAQFEWEVAGKHIRDKFAVSRRKGMWMGGTVPLGYRVKDRKLVVDAAEADTSRPTSSPMPTRCAPRCGELCEFRAVDLQKPQLHEPGGFGGQVSLVGRKRRCLGLAGGIEAKHDDGRRRIGVGSLNSAPGIRRGL
jgi:hypothetical protein